MNYREHYTKLIDRAKDRNIGIYTERHHITPRCMGGSDESFNLVDLTAREHFIAHLLLLKIYPKQYGLIKAVNMMCCIGNGQQRLQNRMYSWLKEKLSKEFSANQLGKNNSCYGTCWISHLKLKICFKIKKENYFEYMLDGFIKKRIMKFIDPVKCKICGKLTNKKSSLCSHSCTINFQKQEGTYINGYKNKKHSETWKQSMKGHDRNNGINNPMYGMRVIHNPETLEFKKCKGDELNNLLSSGWCFGKKPKL